MSCPKLMRKAYTADKIDEQLNQAAKQFINSDKNDLSSTPPKVSMVFKWYKKAITENGGTVVDFINKYAGNAIPKNTELSYKDYDWSLNEQK